MKKDKEEILSISNKFQLGLCIEDKKSDMIDSKLQKKKTIQDENKILMKKKRYNFKNYKIDEIKSINEERLKKLTLSNFNTLYIFDGVKGRFFKSIELIYGIQKFYTTINNYICLWYNNNGWNKEIFNDLFIKYDESKVKKLKECLPHHSKEFENKLLSFLVLMTFIVKMK